jgi:hypothetical protein
MLQPGRLGAKDTGLWIAPGRVEGIPGDGGSNPPRANIFIKIPGFYYKFYKFF